MSDGNFDFQRRLGSGHFGEVWLVMDTGLDCHRAVKCIPVDKVINSQNFFQEAQILKLAEHPNIVTVYEANYLTDGRIYVSMEYLPNGSLEDDASGSYVPLSKAKRLMVHVLRGLSHAHSKGIVHRDIKPANVMIGQNGEGKLSDFGLAVKDIATFDASALKHYNYILHLAPEVSSFSDFSIASDIYACGVTLYRLVNGDEFVSGIPIQDVRRLARKAEFPDRGKYREFVPSALRKVINRAISVNPNERFESAEVMRHALEKVPTAMDWNERKLNNGFLWTGSTNRIQASVRRSKDVDGSWSVVVKKGKLSLRRDNSLSKFATTKSSAESHTRKVLQGFVTGKR